MLRQYISLPRQVHILCLGTFVNRAGTFLVPFLTLYLAKKLHFGQSFATLGMGAYGVGALCAATLGGYLADRLGRKQVMLVSLFGGAAILAVFGFLASKPAILIAIVCLAAVGESYRPAASAMIADLTHPHERPQAYGLHYVSVNLGFAVAPLVGGFVAQYSYRLLFWGDALTCTAYGFIILLAIAETLPSAAGTAPARAGEAPAAPRASPAEVFRCIIGDRVFLVFCLATLLVGIIYMQGMSTLPLYLDGLKFGESVYGRIIAVNGVLITLFQLPLTVVLNRFNRARVMVASACVSGVGFGLLAWAQVPWQFAATVVVWTIGEMMQSPYLSSIVADLAPFRHRAAYMGALGFTFSSAMSIGVPLGGVVLEHLGGKALWLGSFGLSLMAAALYARIRRQIAAPTGDVRPAPPDAAARATPE